MVLLLKVKEIISSQWKKSRQVLWGGQDDTKSPQGHFQMEEEEGETTTLHQVEPSTCQCSKEALSSLPLTSTESQSSSFSTTTPFESSTSSLIRTGNSAFDQDISEVMEYFDCELEPTFVDGKSQIFSALVKLPFYAPGSRSCEFSYLRVIGRPPTISEHGKYNVEYRMEKLAPSLQAYSKQEQNDWLKVATERTLCLIPPPPSSSSTTPHRPQRDNPSIISFIDSFYCTLEDYIHPGKEIIIRDFCYSVYDPRHWGRPLPGQLDRLVVNHQVYRARAKFDFDAAVEGELSIRENDTLLIMANLGNGWLSARKYLPRSEGGDGDGEGEEGGGGGYKGGDPEGDGGEDGGDKDRGKDCHKDCGMDVNGNSNNNSDKAGREQTTPPPSSIETMKNVKSGLVPENYVQRIQ